MDHQRNVWNRLGAVLLIAVLAGALPGTPAITQAQSGGTIGYGAKVSASLSPDAPRATYGFSASAQDWISAIAEPLAGTLDLQLELIAPNGLLLDISTQNTLAGDTRGAALSAVLAETGVYLLRVSAQGEGAGDFLLTLLGRPARPATLLSFGQPVEVQIEPGATPQHFAFDAEDCPTTLVVTNLSQGQPYTFPFAVRLIDQRGQFVPFQRGGEQLEDRVTVTPRSGRYEVEVTSSDPLAAGSVRLLVTCGADAPGCAAASQPAIPGVPGLTPVECVTCPDPDRPPEEGGCPDLEFTAAQAADNPLHIGVGWLPLPGADGYTVQVNGLVDGGGEVYLTHAHWTPGDPTVLDWILPEWYIGFRFILRVLAGDVVICTAETTVMLPGEQRVCPRLNLSGTILDPVARSVRWTWTPAPEAERYDIQLRRLRGDSPAELFDTGVLDARAEVLDAAYPDSAPGDIIRLSLFIVIGGNPVCPEEAEVVFEGAPPGQQQPLCAVVTESATIAARLGAGLDRAVFAWLTPGTHYLVTGQAYDAAGNLWWQIDTSLFAGHEAVASLWVLASEVLALGNCNVVPPAVPPPVIPAEPQPGAPGQWLPCGSCDTCGHPANECVTSPEGQCLWDPTFCANAPPGQPGQPGGTTCFAINAAVDMSGCQYTQGSAMIDVRPNCEGSLYLPGTAMYAHAVAVDPKCNVDYWSGCGAGGGDNSVSFTATGSCTAVAHMHYGN